LGHRKGSEGEAAASIALTAWYCAVDTRGDRLRQFGGVNPSDFFISLSRRRSPARWLFTSGHFPAREGKDGEN
jgi:hypothetical protein